MILSRHTDPFVIYSEVTPAICIWGHWIKNKHPKIKAIIATMRSILMIPLTFNLSFFTSNPPNSIPPPAPGTVTIPVRRFCLLLLYLWFTNNHFPVILPRSAKIHLYATNPSEVQQKELVNWIFPGKTWLQRQQFHWRSSPLYKLPGRGTGKSDSLSIV